MFMLLVVGKQMMVHLADARGQIGKMKGISSNEYPLLKQAEKQKRAKKLDELLELLKKYVHSDVKMKDLHKTLTDFLRIKYLEHKEQYEGDRKKPLAIRTTQEWTANYPTNTQAQRIHGMLANVGTR